MDLKLLVAECWSSMGSDPVQCVGLYHDEVQEVEEGPPPPLDCPVWKAVIGHQLVRPIDSSHELVILINHMWLLDVLNSAWCQSLSSALGHLRGIVHCGQHCDRTLVHPLQCQQRTFRTHRQYLPLLKLLSHLTGDTPAVNADGTTGPKTLAVEVKEECWAGVEIVCVDVVPLMLQTLHELQYYCMCQAYFSHSQCIILSYDQ